MKTILPHIALVLDHDPDTRTAIVDQLRADGLNAQACTTVDMLRDEVIRQHVDICLIGARLSDGDGIALVRELRQNSGAGLIVLGESADEVDTVLALEMGADDYVVKPVRPREIGARARSVIRRTLSRNLENNDAPRPMPDHYLRRLGNLEICGIARSVTKDGVLVDLTTLEFDVLLVLVSQANSILSRTRIIEAVRGREWAANDRVVDGIVSRLRRKLFDDGQGIQRIKTVHGRGYILFDDQALSNG